MVVISRSIRIVRSDADGMAGPGSVECIVV